jgi:hypothetical protein
MISGHLRDLGAVGHVLVVTTLGGIVLSVQRGTRMASDRTEVAAVPSVLAGSVRHACSY